MVTPTSSQSVRGFSLVELLAVIAIIGILAAITLPVIGHVREKARSGQCVSNLRQIGVGIQLYSQANKGKLPGPLYTSQGPRFTPANTNSGQMTVYLEPYLESNTGVAGSTLTKVQEMFNCPSWNRDTPDQTGPSMQVNNYPSWGGTQVVPFGDFSLGAKPRTAMSIAEYPLAKTWMLVDLDKVWMGSATAGWINQIPAKPVHGSGWNALYYDGHVGRIALSER